MTLPSTISSIKAKVKARSQTASMTIVTVTHNASYISVLAPTITNLRLLATILQQFFGITIVIFSALRIHLILAIIFQQSCLALGVLLSWGFRISDMVLINGYYTLQFLLSHGPDAAKLLLNRSLYASQFFQTHGLYASRLLLSHGYYLSQLILLHSFYTSQFMLRVCNLASRLLLAQTYYGSSVLSKELFLRMKQVGMLGWRASEKLRKKLSFELMAFVMGGGYICALIVLWPGWILMGVAWGLWRLLCCLFY